MVAATSPTEAAAVGPGRGLDWTRYAPAPTGYLHLGHVANAIWVWGMAAANGLQVLLRIEDHDRERSRAMYDTALLEDLEWLGFVPDAGPVRQRDDGRPYLGAADELRAAGLAYACDCSRATFATWRQAHERGWLGPGCPGGCRERHLPEERGRTLRVALGTGTESWTDRCLGARTGEPWGAGDLAILDRDGNWTYGFCVVVDDLREEIGMVVRGEDLVDATPGQIRLGRLLGRLEPPVFAHHPLILKPGGAKLSKGDGDTGIRELRAAGRSAAQVIGAAAFAVGLLPSAQRLKASQVGRLFAP